MASNDIVKVVPGALVCAESKLSGSITVGTSTVIHPYASLIAKAGPIVLGENNIIEKEAVIKHVSGGEDNKTNPITLFIGVNNVFGEGCEIHAKTIGDYNVFEAKCYVGPNIEIGNGCIVGAGCRITVASELLDQVVVVGPLCGLRCAVDKPQDSDDSSSQKMELDVLENIYSKEEFSYRSIDNGLCAFFQIHVELPTNFFLSVSKDTEKTEFSNLPPISLVANLPEDYPSCSPPEFYISCSWLSKEKLFLLVAEVEKLWNDKIVQSEILFDWYSSLKDQAFDWLNMPNCYVLNEKFSIQPGNQNPTNEKTKVEDSFGLVPQNNCGENNDYLMNKVKEKLTLEAFAQLKARHMKAIEQFYIHLVEEKFKKALQECNVCTDQVLGELCKLLSCGHVTCIECLKKHCETIITSGNVKFLSCPECSITFETNLIRELVSKEMFDRYDKILLTKSLEEISNMTYCPRVNCQYPVCTQDDEPLAICPSCSNAFCKYCKRAYHGIENCNLKSEEKSALIEMYQKADYKKKLELENQYGKKQLIKLVTIAQSEKWMSENSKPCPCCNVKIEKNDGCNKMACQNCQAYFCWICLDRLPRRNPYSHFSNPNSGCYNALFPVEAVEGYEYVEEEDQE